MEREEYDLLTDALRRVDHPGDTRTELWREVVIQSGFEAVMHKFSTTNGYNGESEFYVVRAQSRAWFRAASPDFRLVCDLAYFTPEYVLRVMNTIFARADAQLEARKAKASTGKVPARPRRRRNKRAMPFPIHVSYGQVAAV